MRQARYVGDTLGQEWPTPAYETDPQADWYTTEDETCDGIVDLYRRVWAFADATIEELPLGPPVTEGASPASAADHRQDAAGANPGP